MSTTPTLEQRKRRIAPHHWVRRRHRPDVVAPAPQAKERAATTETTRHWLRQVVFAFSFLALVGGWAVTLRPQAIGGPAGYVMVRGTSMLGTYNPGDLVIVRRETSYLNGDIVAYRVPDGEVGAGIMVIHRITGGSATAGFVLQGDNNESPDDWHPTRNDIVGKAWLVVPKLGRVLAFLHAPIPLASLAAGVAMALVIDPGKKRAKGERKRRRKRSKETSK